MRALFCPDPPRPPLPILLLLLLLHLVAGHTLTSGGKSRSVLAAAASSSSSSTAAAAAADLAHASSFTNLSIFVSDSTGEDSPTCGHLLQPCRCVIAAPPPSPKYAAPQPPNPLPLPPASRSLSHAVLVARPPSRMRMVMLLSGNPLDPNPKTQNPKTKNSSMRRQTSNSNPCQVITKAHSTSGNQ